MFCFDCVDYAHRRESDYTACKCCISCDLCGCMFKPRENPIVLNNNARASWTCRACKPLTLANDALACENCGEPVDLHGRPAPRLTGPLCDECATDWQQHHNEHELADMAAAADHTPPAAALVNNDRMSLDEPPAT